MRILRLVLGAVGAVLLVLFTAGPALADVVRVTGSGSGADEAPDPGEDGARITGDFTIDTESGKITYTVKVSGNSEDAVAAHIHKAPPGQAGDVVVPLDPAAVNAGSETTTTADPAIAADIAAHPGDYYVNAHSPSFQGGFARAQLEAAAPGSVAAGDGSGVSTAPRLLGVVLLVVGVAAVAFGLYRRRGESA